MKDLTQFTIKVQDALTKLRDEFEATHDDLVRVVGYAMDAIKFLSAPTATLNEKGLAEKKAKDEQAKSKSTVAPRPASPATQVKPTATPSNPIVK